MSKRSMRSEGGGEREAARLDTCARLAKRVGLQPPSATSFKMRAIISSGTSCFCLNKFFIKVMAIVVKN